MPTMAPSDMVNGRSSVLSALMDKEEWQVRVDLATAYQFCHAQGLNEGICNHLTAMVAPDKFLVIPYGLMWSEVTPSNLLTVDAMGNVVNGEGEVEITAFHIHKALHMYNPAKAACVLHTHMPWSTSLCCLKDFRLPMIHQNCLRFWNDIAYDTTFNGLVVSEDEGDRLARFMGAKRVLFHSNHGVIVTGRTVAEAVDDLYYLERAAEVVVKALSTQRELQYISEKVAQDFKQDFDIHGKQEGAALHLAALKRQFNEAGALQ